MRYSLADVARVAGGRYSGEPLEVDAYATDSRRASAGTLFFALKGAELDGHDFVADAAARGATGVVVERPLDIAAPQVVVDSTWEALFALAADALHATGPLAVGVTGSNGKTSTKDFVAAALGGRYRALKTEGNLNTETGVPLTLLRLEPGVHTALVAEMGMQGPGEIARLAKLVQPAIGVITVIGTVHLEFFPSREDLARAKGELLEALPPDGVAVLNADDPYTELLRSLTTARIVTFGGEGADYAVQDYVGSTFSVRGHEVHLQLPGRHQALNAAAALAVAEAAGVPLAEAAPRLAEVAPAKGRMREVRAARGFTILDDSYNASPESMEAAFAVVAEHPGRRRLAVLGEMRELGALAGPEHERIGRLAKDVFDGVAVVDTGEAGKLATAAGAELVPDAEAARLWVQEHAGEGDLVLVKASRGVALERLVDALVES
ncbi:MAG TPA: UDP-N-acetylmuramoyl-tripeptide--D-alanyl-D-alanine ligase [Candidatus Dormibacteraeota bacterium]